MPAKIQVRPRFVEISFKGIRAVSKFTEVDKFYGITFDGYFVDLYVRESEGKKYFVFQTFQNYIGWTENSKEAFEFFDLIAISTLNEVESRKLRSLKK